MTESEFERRLKALQQEISESYLKGYNEARQRAQWTIAAAVDESTRLRNALEWALDEVQDESRRVRILAAMHRRQSTDHERD
jgi:molybdopterin-biosynthesis enzyme MoeA-like protein